MWSPAGATMRRDHSGATMEADNGSGTFGGQ